MVLSKDLLAIHGGGREGGRGGWKGCRTSSKEGLVIDAAAPPDSTRDGREKKMETTKESFDVESCRHRYSYWPDVTRDVCVPRDEY